MSPANVRLEGVLTLPDGETVNLLVLPNGSYQQWGANREHLGSAVDLVTTIAEAFASWCHEQ